MALCTVLILVLVPTFAIAAGPQGSGPQSQQETAAETANQEQNRTCLQQGNGTGQMLQNRICDQDGDELRNKTGSTIQQRGASREWQGAGYHRSTELGNSLALQNGNQTSQSQDRISGQKCTRSGLRSGIGSGDHIRDQVRDGARNQASLKDGSCGSSLNL